MTKKELPMAASTLLTEVCSKALSGNWLFKSASRSSSCWVVSVWLPGSVMVMVWLPETSVPLCTVVSDMDSELSTSDWTAFKSASPW